MNNKHFQWVLYVIVIVILGTISIQLYWNYKNYQTNKQQLINDVQVSLDNAHSITPTTWSETLLSFHGLKEKMQK